MRYLTIFILIINSTIAQSQIFDIEQANPNVKWKQINSSNFRLIFPEKFISKATSLANSIDFQLQYSYGDLQRKPKKINIILQENTLDQNGFVQLAPRKSELYSTPSGIADNQTWLDNLTLHEMRHVAQFDNLTGKLNKPYGEQLALALFALNLPTWFFEGDAVLHETLYSKGGRGRLSSWQMPIRANIQSDLNFDFNKYVHGSFKDIVPSYYTIGYFMNSELYQKDPKITSKIFTNTRSKLLRPYNFQRAIKTYYGSNTSNLFNNTMTNLKKNWSEKSGNKYKNRIYFNDKYPTDYLIPQVNNKTIYSLQRSPQRVNRIVKTDSENPNSITEVVKLGAQIMPYFDINDHLIVWDEYRRNPRYSKETFNVINLYNTQTNEIKTITKDSRYYTPTLSPDLKKIACVEVDEANNSYLIELNILTNKKIKSIKIPEGIHIQQPKYHQNGERIVTIGVSNEGTNLIEIDLKTENIKMLTVWSNQQIERPIYLEDDVIFKSNLDNKDDIFQLHNAQIYRITDAEFGAFNPSIEGGKLYFNDYTTHGYKINHIDLNSLSIVSIAPQISETLYSSQNDFIVPDSSISQKNDYKIEDYKSLAHAINFHSISLSGSNFENFDNLKPGIFLLSNDVLNTTQAKIGFEYDTNIKKTTYSAEISYQKYYPKITLGYKNRGLIGAASKQSNPDSIQYFDFRENMASLDIQLPFVKYKGNSIYSYGLNFGTSYQHRYNTSILLQNFNTDIIFPLNYQLYINKNVRRSKMDIFPRWGQNFNFIYRHLPFENNLNGTSWSIRTTFYFPGVAINHGIRLRYAMQENTGKFTNSYDIPLISGISYIPYKNIKNTLLLDYQLPLSYPDWSLGQLAYLKRIYGGISANYMNIQESNITPQSISASLFFDFNMFKYTLPNFLFEAKGSYITVGNSTKNFFPEFSLSYSY